MNSKSLARNLAGRLPSKAAIYRLAVELLMYVDADKVNIVQQAYRGLTAEEKTMDNKKIAKELTRLAKGLIADKVEIFAHDYETNGEYEIQIFSDEDFVDITPKIKQNQAKVAKEIANYLNRKFFVDATAQKTSYGYAVYSDWTDDMFGFAESSTMKRLFKRYNVSFES